jgi:hypothetical protein
MTDFPKLSGPAQRALANAGYTEVEQLVGVSEADLLRLHGLGPSAPDSPRARSRKYGSRIPPAAEPGIGTSARAEFCRTLRDLFGASTPRSNSLWQSCPPGQ